MLQAPCCLNPALGEVKTNVSFRLQFEQGFLWTSYLIDQFVSVHAVWLFFIEHFQKYAEDKATSKRRSLPY